MPAFAHPEFLALAPLAAALAWWWSRRRRLAFRYPDVRLVNGLPRGRAGWATWGGATLRGSSLFALTLAVAGPRTPDLRTPIPVEGVAIVLALDVSGSMATPDFAPSPDSPPVTRLEAAKGAFRLFVAGGDAADGSHFDGRPRDQIGLVTFAAVPQTDCPLTMDHSALLVVTAALKPKEGIDAGTNIGDAIAEGLARLDAAGAKRKVLILLSDGEHNIHLDRPDPPFMPRQAAKLAATLGVPVYAVDCGGDPRSDATPDEAKQRQDGRRVLEAVAEATGGRTFAANTADELRQVYREIDALERTPAVSNRYRRYREFYPWCAAAAVGLVGAVALLERTWWRRLPG